MENNRNNKNLLLKESYFYDLPPELIAQTPIEPRDNSRLLIYDRKNNTISHRHFKDIIDFFVRYADIPKREIGDITIKIILLSMFYQVMKILEI